MPGTLGGPDIAKLVDLTYSDARFNLIDDPSNLKDDKTFYSQVQCCTLFIRTCLYSMNVSSESN